MGEDQSFAILGRVQGRCGHHRTSFRSVAITAHGRFGSQDSATLAISTPSWLISSRSRMAERLEYSLPTNRQRSIGNSLVYRNRWLTAAKGSAGAPRGCDEWISFRRDAVADFAGGLDGLGFPVGFPAVGIRVFINGTKLDGHDRPPSSRDARCISRRTRLRSAFTVRTC